MENTTSYTPGQVESVLRAVGVSIISETREAYLCLCPYHNNTDTPSFAISKTMGAFMCFSPSCQKKGNLIKLVVDKTGKSLMEAARIIIRCEGKQPELIDRVRGALHRHENVTFDIEVINRMHADIWGSKALDYLHGRSINDESVSTFKIGYSVKQNMVVVPMFDVNGRPVGIIGRSIEGKRFKNSRKLPSSEMWFNLNRAKRAGDVVIVVESSFDAIRVHQAGFPNVVAILGGHIPDDKAELLRRHFNGIIIATDNDKKKFYENCFRCGSICKGHNAGRDIGQTILDKFGGMRISWAAYDEKVIYPHDAKDVSDLTDEEIQQCVGEPVSNFIYQRWNLS